MDELAIKIVSEHIEDYFNPFGLHFEIYIVWKCKTLQNWKYLISTSLCDGMYYELTYNGDIKEWYIDAYKKVKNTIISN